VVKTDKGGLSKFLQHTVGDALVQKDGIAYGVEFKIEQRWTGNFFLETWSNKKWETPGWLFTLDTDVLLYYFEDKRLLYSIPFQKLKKWAETQGNMEPFPEKAQRKYDQKNDTWGRCVPIGVVTEQVGCQTYQL